MTIVRYSETIQRISSDIEDDKTEERMMNCNYREILHVDFNNFFASVECLHDPSLSRQAFAVAGNAAERRGIILSKNYIAKDFGVKTAESIGEARSKCPCLVLVEPHYELYERYSKMAHELFESYTDRVEAMGADEAWLDVTGCERYLHRTAAECADDIRAIVREQLGLTVSVGVSFNKVFAKLGSDMKKPDATTVISPDNFRELVWPLRVSDMIGIGTSTATALASFGVHTVGQLAMTSPELLRARFGKVGVYLSRCARGEEDAPVARVAFDFPVKTVGHGSNALTDLTDPEQVRPFILSLTPDIAHRLRLAKKYAHGVSVSVRDNNLKTQEYQMQLPTPTRSPSVLAREAFALFSNRHEWRRPLRSVCVRAICLSDERTPLQPSLFGNPYEDERTERLDDTVDLLRRRYGAGTLVSGAVYRNPDVTMDTDRVNEERVSWYA